jgi:hypothetical protein
MKIPFGNNHFCLFYHGCLLYDITEFVLLAKLMYNSAIAAGMQPVGLALRSQLEQRN